MSSRMTAAVHIIRMHACVSYAARLNFDLRHPRNSILESCRHGALTSSKVIMAATLAALQGIQCLLTFPPMLCTEAAGDRAPGEEGAARGEAPRRPDRCGGNAGGPTIWLWCVPGAPQHL